MFLGLERQPLHCNSIYGLCIILGFQPEIQGTAQARRLPCTQLPVLSCECQSMLWKTTTLFQGLHLKFSIDKDEGGFRRSHSNIVS